MKNQRLYFLSLVLIGFAIFRARPNIGFVGNDMPVLPQIMFDLTLAIGVTVAAHFAGRSWKMGSRWIAIILTLIVLGQFILSGQVWEHFFIELGWYSPEEAQPHASLLVVTNIFFYSLATVLSHARHDVSPKIEEVG